MARLDFKEYVNKGMTWVLGVLFVFVLGFVANDRVKIGEKIADNREAIVAIQRDYASKDVIEARLDELKAYIARCINADRRGEQCE